MIHFVYVIFTYNIYKMEKTLSTANLRKVGGSTMLVVPPAILDLLHLRAGATVDITVEGGRLVIETKPLPFYTLDELLAQCDASAEPSVQDQQWFDTKPVGSELL